MAAPQGGGSPANETAWNDDGLEDDVASIGYEQALRSPAAAADDGIASDPKELPKSPKPLKTASITIRLSEEECAQLRQRAAEAGMTISAYLRSCTLEVESLRAQVKQTLSEMRSTARAQTEEEARPDPPGLLKRLVHALSAWMRQWNRPARIAMPLNPANPFAPAND